MLEGNVLDYPSPLTSQPSPEQAAAPAHNGFALAVRGVRFCGGSMKAPVVSMAPNKSEPQYIRPLMPPSRAPNVKAAAPVNQRRRSSGAGKKGAVAGKALITTPVSTPLPAEITSRLKSPSTERPKFSDRLNALLRTGVATANHEFEDDKDPYAFVDSEVNRLQQQQQQQRPLQQTVRNNVVKRSPASIPNVNTVIKSKKRKQNNVTVSIPSPKNSSILPQQQQQQQQNVTVQKQHQQQQQIIAIQRQQQNIIRQQTQIAVKQQQQQQQLAAKQLQQQQLLAKQQQQQQQLLAKQQQQQLVAKQQQQQIAAKQQIQQQQIVARQQVQNIVRQQQIVSRQEPSATSANIASSPNATSILRTVKFAEQLNNRRLSLSNDDRLKLNNSHNNVSNSQQTSHQPNLVTRIPVTLPSTSLPPPSLTPLLKNSSIIEEEKQSTTMNQLQAKIARNKVIGKHRNKITTTTSTSNSLSSHSQPIIASPSNIISSQQLSKLKERSLLEEQLLLGIKQEKLLSSPSTVKQLQHNPQQIKTVTQHFTFPAKSAGSVVTYKRPLTQSPTSKPEVSLLPCKRAVKKTVSSTEVAVDSPYKQQLARIEQRKDDEKAFRQDLFPLGLESDSGAEVSEDEDLSAFQRDWFLPSPPESSTGNEREDRLSNVKSTIRRRYVQLRKAETHWMSRGSSGARGSSEGSGQAVRALIAAARCQPNRTAAMLLAQPNSVTTPGIPPRPRAKHRPKSRLVRQVRCCYADCSETALPCTRHCIRHVMYNVDQLLFEHCTAKFADNTQCCVPVFDIMHELPLCLEHARKRDNYSKMNSDTRPKKTRRKAKPSAMTRPSKRGKKRRRAGSQSNTPPTPPAPVVVKIPQPTPQIVHVVHQPPPQPPSRQPSPPSLHLNSLGQRVFLTHIPQQQHQHHHHHQQHSPPDIVEAQGIVPMMITTEDSLSQSQPDTNSMLADTHGGCSDSDGDMAGLLEEVEAQGAALSPGVMLSDELPLESAEELAQQASRLLEEHDDLASVLCQIPADTLNELFNGEKTGVYEPTREETEELERALEAVDKDVKSLEKMSRQQGGPAPPPTSVLPSELVESILGPHIVDDHALSMALARHALVVKEEVVVEGSHLIGSSQHPQLLIGQQHLTLNQINGYQVHSGGDHLSSQMLPSQDSMIQLDAAVFPEGITLDLHQGSFLLHQSGGSAMHQPGATLLHQPQQQQQQQMMSSDVNSLLHHGLLPQMPHLSSESQQLMLNPAVYGGGAAPPPTLSSIHHPAVANTPPYHPQNGFLLGQQGSQFDPKAASAVVFSSPLPSAPSPAMSPAQFSPATPNTSNMATQTQTDS